MKRAVVLHNAVAADAPPDERDVLAQVEAVTRALEEQGYAVVPLAVDLDLAALDRELARTRPAVVFNLVESLGGSERLMGAVPALLESAGRPFTGAGAECLALCGNKVVAKRWLVAAGLPTPRWREDPGATDGFAPGSRVIVKSRWDHGSLGLEAERVGAPGAGLHRADGDLFAEEFVDGREFNLSVLGGRAGPSVLPPAEIRFEDFGERPRIVGWRAKWDPDSFEHAHTPRTFELARADGALVSELVRIARACWSEFGLSGYARVDFRVDERGRPFVLEVNPNPCLSDDAGFQAAARTAGLGFRDVVARILEDAFARPGVP